MNSLKHSLRLRLAVILMGITAGVTIAGALIYSAFLGNYFTTSKTNALLDVYEDLNTSIVYNEQVDAVVASEEGLQRLGAKGYNQGIQMLVVDTSYRVVFANVYNEDMAEGDNLLNRIKEIIFGVEIKGTNTAILEENDNYKLYIYEKSSDNNSYIEMWGELECGYLFLMRVSGESITSTVNIANSFYLNIALVMTIMGVILMSFIATRITKPIRELAAVSKKMSNLEFDTKYTGNAKDEIGILGESMNEMSNVLEKTISELKTANNQLKKDIEAKTEIDNLRKEFISNVSHELKTPIALIQGYAEGLRESVNDDEESREFYCEVIVDEASKMNKMVKKLLTLNQIEFGNIRAEYERFDIIQTIDNILNQTQILIVEKGAKIDFDNSIQVMVWSDEFQIEEVITNYISNAINHLGNEMVIRITVENRDDIVRVIIANSGDNIPENSIGRIWDKFYKVDKARTREYGGSGIGLSIVKAIMDSIHMKCGVNNTPGGVEFWFEVESGQDLKK